MECLRIYAHVDERQLGRLDQYTRELGLSSNAPLLALLVSRAVNNPGYRDRLVVAESSAGGKVVVKLQPAMAKEFLKLLETLRCSRTALASSLLVQELEERWLEKALSND